MTGVLRDTVTDETSELEVDGVFVAVGHDPNTALFLDWLDHDDQGYLVTEPGSTRTNIAGVFAAGDVQITPTGRPSPRPAPGRWPRSTPSATSKSGDTSTSDGLVGVARGFRPNPKLGSRFVATRWLDLVDPTSEELRGAPRPRRPCRRRGPRSTACRGPRAAAGGRGSRRLRLRGAGRDAAAGRSPRRPSEIAFVATARLLVTVRKSPRDGPAYEPSVLPPAAEAGLPVGILVQRLIDDVADTYLDLLDDLRRDRRARGPHRRARPSLTAIRLGLRHELLHRRRTVSATRAAIRRILDGASTWVTMHCSLPRSNAVFGDTCDTLVRVARARRRA